jgi:hypothetical protein
MTQKTNEELIQDIEALKDVLIGAMTDIRQWVQLARYQRRKMDQNLGWCPTERALSDSQSVTDRIRDVLNRTVSNEPA